MYPGKYNNMAGPVIKTSQILPPVCLLPCCQPSFPLDFVLDVEDLYANTEEDKRSLLASVAKTDLFVAARLDKGQPSVNQEV